MDDCKACGGTGFGKYRKNGCSDCGGAGILPLARFVHVDGFKCGALYVEFAEGSKTGRSIYANGVLGAPEYTRESVARFIARGLWKPYYGAVLLAVDEAEEVTQASLDKIAAACNGKPNDPAHGVVYRVISTPGGKQPHDWPYCHTLPAAPAPQRLEIWRWRWADEPDAWKLSAEVVNDKPGVVVEKWIATKAEG